ncbi:MAG: isochorismatase family protein [Pirellulales bacterium]
MKRIQGERQMGVGARAVVWSVVATLLALISAVATNAQEPLKVNLRRQVRDGEGWSVQESRESWTPSHTALIVCDVWDAHHCLNAVWRVEEMAPRMNQVLHAARKRGVLIVHAPSSCMAAYEGHPARLRAQQAPQAANLPADIGQWCHQIPSEERVLYPVDQTDGGEDDDPAQHKAWHARLAGMGRNPRAPWKRQIDVLEIRPEDAISDSGVEIWNLLEQRQIKNVVLLGVHTNMCVLGRPFGLRQLSKNGKNVVLMRDMTDTMYNPQRWPYVSHFEGTRRIVEHIERVVCPTITSVDFLGGEAFRFQGDRRQIVMMIGEDEYKTNETLPEFAKTELEPAGYRVRIVHSSADNPNDFPGLEEALREADLLLVSVRRRTPPQAQLDAVREHVAAWKPLVGIRTASHAFSLRNNQPPAEGCASWLDFDPAVLGGRYVGHHGAGPQTVVAAAPGAAADPILAGIDLTKLVGNGSLYRVTPLEPSTTPLLLGTVPNHPTEPVAWTNCPRLGGGRVFYTSFGHVEDFKNPEFRRLLLHGICWGLENAPPAIAAARGPRPELKPK